jgi:hypothetical protein
MGELKRRGMLLLLSALMLVSAGAYLTFAWYTKMTSVSGMEFNAAQWEFTANYEVSDFNINVMSYDALNEGKAGPGTKGEIPIVLGAVQSDTDVDYEIWIDKSTMSKEFQDRIYFYVDKAMTTEFVSTTPLEGTIKKGQSETVTIYWKWIYEYKDMPGVNQSAADFAENSKEFDKFDTEVGKHPEMYRDQMSATLSIVGTQKSPAAVANPVVNG